MIGRFVRWLFNPHRHEWELIQHNDIVAWNDPNIKRGSFTMQRCKTCGKLYSRSHWA
jgi:hypothetical protein